MEFSDSSSRNFKNLCRLVSALRLRATHNWATAKPFGVQ